MDADYSLHPNQGSGLTVRFVGSHAVVWVFASAIVGAAVARVAEWIQHVRAPVLLFPFLVGGCLGLLLFGLMRVVQVGRRPTLWGGAILAVAVAVVGEHYISYREDGRHEADYWAKQPANLSPELFREMIPQPPASFWEYMQRQAKRGRPLFSEITLRGSAAWVSWIVDGLLTLLGTLVVVIPVSRQPHCSHHPEDQPQPNGGGREPADAVGI